MSLMGWLGRKTSTQTVIVDLVIYNPSNTVELQWLEHRWLVYLGLFELIFESLRDFSDSSRKQILREVFLFYHEIVCCVYILESSHRYDSNEYTQHTIILLKTENISLNYRHLLPDLAPWLNLTGSNKFPWSQRCSSHWSLTVVCARIGIVQALLLSALNRIWFSSTGKTITWWSNFLRHKITVVFISPRHMYRENWVSCIYCLTASCQTVTYLLS